MNDMTPPRPTVEADRPKGAEAPPASSRPPMTREDQELLPAELSIVERPPSPIAMALMLSICALALLALIWSWVGHTDIVAVAHGKIQPHGRVKVVQPLETGRVRSIKVANGEVVREGDVLIELDPDEAIAEFRAAEASLMNLQGEILRRRAGIAAAYTKEQTAPPISWPASLPPAVTMREEALLQAELRQLRTQIAALAVQERQKIAERSRHQALIEAQEGLIAIQKDRVDIRSSLFESKAGSLSNLLDAREAMQYQQTVLATARGQLFEAEHAILAIEAEREKTVQAFLADNYTKLADAHKGADETEQRLARARAKLDRMTLRSPASGTIQALSVTSIGQVLGAGQEVMRVVPDAPILEYEVYLENKDIGFVTVGQAASIKIEAFPFTRHGTIEATVVHIASDAIPEPDARQIEGDPTRSVASRGAAGAERVRSLVFPIVLRSEVWRINANGRPVPLVPGMAVTAEIKTGHRRLIDYIFSPIVEVTTQALRER